MWDGECSVWASPIAWSGRAVCLGQHLQVFPWLCPPRPLGGVPILLTEHGSTWQCPGSQEERACENLLPFSFSKHRTLSSSVPFQPCWVLLSQRYLLLWKISKIYKSQEDSATINPHAPITPVHSPVIALWLFSFHLYPPLPSPGYHKAKTKHFCFMLSRD